MNDRSWDTIVVGGGLGGLATVARLARAGQRVALLESTGALGGRATSRNRDGFVLNLGPHALYRGGAATEVLDGGAAVHVAKYLPQGDAGEARESRGELEELLERMQPGWRRELVDRRFVPHLKVTEALPAAADGGLAGRPGPEVRGVAGLFVVGDWVGGHGLLADAVPRTAAASLWTSARTAGSGASGRSSSRAR